MLRDPRGILAGILLAGLCLRFPLLLQAGYSGDVQLFARWASFVNEGGLTAAYAEQANYPPLYLYVLGALARFGTALGVGGSFISGALPVLLLKTPALLADLLLGVAVYWAARPWLGPGRALLSTAAVVLNPGLVYATAYWGQVDSIHTLFMVAALGAAQRGQSALSGAAGAVALATKAQSLVVLPILFVLALRHGPRPIAAMLLGGLAASALLLVPAVLEHALPQVADVYLGVTSTTRTFTVNAFNLWEIFLQSPIRGASVTGLDDRELFLGPLSYFVVGLTLLAGWSVLNMLLLARRGTETWLIWPSAAAVALGFFFFPTQIHERYLYPAVVFLSVVFLRDRWLAVSWTVLSITFFLNLTLVFPPPDPWGSAFRGASDGVRLGVAVANGVVMALLLGWMGRSHISTVVAPPARLSEPRLRWAAASAAAAVGLVAASALQAQWLPWEPSPYVASAAPPEASVVDLQPAAGFHLAAFQMTPSCPRPGNVVRVSLYWEATQRDLPAAESVIVLTRDQRPATRLSQRDPGGILYPTQRWQPGKLVRDDHEFWVADNLPPGSYAFNAGVAPKGGGAEVPAALPFLTARWERLPTGEATARCSPAS